MTRPFRSDAEELEIVKALNRSLLIFDNQHRSKIADLQIENAKLREALEPFAEIGETLIHTRGTVHIMNIEMDWLHKARAALAPPPAGEKS